MKQMNTFFQNVFERSCTMSHHPNTQIRNGGISKLDSERGSCFENIINAKTSVELSPKKSSE